MIGAGLLEPGDAVDTGGSSGGIAVCLDEATGRALVLPPGFYSAPAPVPGRWIVGGAMSGTGAALTWLAAIVLAGRWSIEQLLDQERGAGVRPDVEDGRDPGVVADAGGSRLLLKAPQPLGVGREGHRQNLDGDVPAEALVAGAVDLAHTAHADGRDDLVGTELGSGNETHLEVIRAGL